MLRKCYECIGSRYIGSRYIGIRYTLAGEVPQQARYLGRARTRTGVPRPGVYNARGELESCELEAAYSKLRAASWRQAASCERS